MILQGNNVSIVDYEVEVGVVVEAGVGVEVGVEVEVEIMGTYGG